MEKEQKKAEHIASHADVSEKQIERYLVRKVEELGGLCIKYSSHTMAGYPDRIALLPGGKAVWFELKSRGQQSRVLQMMRQSHLLQLGFDVFVCDSKEKVDKALLIYKHGI